MVRTNLGWIDDQANGPYLVISRHDYRSPRKANMHFITNELSKHNVTRFFSFGFSFLSYLKDDPRLSLWKKANNVELHEGVETYLWRTLLHPISLRKRIFRNFEAFLFRLYIKRIPKIFKEWIIQSETIIFESGFPVIFIRLCKKLNPKARLLYIASDDLQTIDCAEYILREFDDVAPSLDGIRLPSALLLSGMPNITTAYFVPHGLDKNIANHINPSPYSGGINAVSVGAMLFDPEFFAIAAAAFPHITFHVIGGGAYAKTLAASNIKIYGEMPFIETIPYLKHADIGIAPYNGRKVAPFLADTSMKLMQFGFLGVPAVCPNIVVGQHEGRFGYTPGDNESITNAIADALKFGHFPSTPTLSWDEVAARILQPLAYEDTKIA